MNPRLGVSIVLLFFALSACGPGGKDSNPALGSKSDEGEPALNLPAEPATVEATRVLPADLSKPNKASPVLKAMETELARWTGPLAKQMPPAHYISYQIMDVREVIIDGVSGSLSSSEDQHARWLDVEVRVGNSTFDNRTTIPGQNQLNSLNYSRNMSAAPIDDDIPAIRHHLWLATDRRYRAALDQFRAVTTQASLVNKSKEAPPVFSHESAETFIEAPAKIEVDKKYWEERMRTCSDRANKGVATRGRCLVRFRTETRYFVNSDGSRIQQSRVHAQLDLSTGVKADDGMPLSRLEQRFSPTVDGLPSEAESEEIVKAIVADLKNLHAAPLAEPYAAPAILEGRAAAVFFHEVFGHRIEGHRQRENDSGQTFAKKVGEKIMPSWLSVIDDPSIKLIGKLPVNGFYLFDDEGVYGTPTTLVDKGIFKGFLLGRTPLKNFPRSNGHGRKEPGYLAVSRQGNLVVRAERSVDRDTLEELLISELKRQRKPYGFIFTDISGGFTNTSRYLPQTFKVQPTLAYKLFPDGRKELVRGIDIVGTPLSALGDILAAGRPVDTFNGMCGAESGWVPVSASAPSLLVKSLEVELAFKNVNQDPVLPPPSIRKSDDSAMGDPR